MDNEQSNGALPPVLSTEQVAELLNLNSRTVLAMVKDGRLPAHRLPGSRKIQYLTAEILATVARAPADVGEEDALVPAAAPAPLSEADPCDIWGAAPTAQSGEDWQERCRSHWIELGRKAGLSPADVSQLHEGAMTDDRSVGAVEIEGLRYEVRAGARQRTRYVDDEGEVRWGLIDAVWVEPIEHRPNSSSMAPPTSRS